MISWMRERGDAVFLHHADAEPHQLVVVGLVPGRAAQGLDAGALGDGDPDFGREDALHVEGDDALLHLAPGDLAQVSFRLMVRLTTSLLPAWWSWESVVK